MAVSEQINLFNLGFSFFILHFLVYPASNGYNSYFDKDEESIGGLKNPPKVSKELYWVSLLFDTIALVVGLLITWEFVAMIFIYGLISKAYSHPSIRLKSKPIAGWLTAGIFQGYFTFLLSYIAINDVSLSSIWAPQIQIPGVLATCLLLGSYPMTQVYQHSEDRKRGDITISLKLGILGTFHFTAVSFFLSSIGFVYYFISFYNTSVAIIFIGSMIPILGYFNLWYFKVRKDETRANFISTMRLNFISSLLLNAFFIYLTLI